MVFKNVCGLTEFDFGLSAFVIIILRQTEIPGILLPTPTSRAIQFVSLKIIFKSILRKNSFSLIYIEIEVEL